MFKGFQLILLNNYLRCQFRSSYYNVTRFLVDFVVELKVSSKSLFRFKKHNVHTADGNSKDPLQIL